MTTATDTKNYDFGIVCYFVISPYLGKRLFDAAQTRTRYYIIISGYARVFV